MSVFIIRGKISFKKHLCFAVLGQLDKEEDSSISSSPATIFVCFPSLSNKIIIDVFTIIFKGFNRYNFKGQFKVTKLHVQ